jgi:Predicted carbamoyl transferase, NodU family
MIINNGVIGWFQGKMEFGPRALGNRSILADPRNKNIKELINKKIKRRESFRPFAPSILSSMQSEWFEEKFNNIYMSAVMTPKKNKANLIPGVVHIDNTSRVQSVNREMNSNFYDLIQSFYKKTNVPILLNTSFNESEPIVNTPEEAIECLLRTNMDALFINSFFVKKI